MQKKLIFVYNAESGIFSSIKESIHKTIAPETYQCNLCRITYGPLTMKQKWREFIHNLDYQTEFLHKDEFLEKYKTNEELPAVFIKNKQLNLLITQKEINNTTGIDSLIDLVKSKIRG